MKELLSWTSEHFYLMLALGSTACVIAVIFFIKNKNIESAISLFLSLALTIISIAGVPDVATNASAGNTSAKENGTITDTIPNNETGQTVQPDTGERDEQLDAVPDDTPLESQETTMPQQITGMDGYSEASPNLDHRYTEASYTLEMDRCNGFSLVVYSTKLRIKNLDRDELQRLGGIDSEAPPITVFLIENETKTLVEAKHANFGESVCFNIDQDGVYYYQVSCQGYETFFSDMLINFQNSDADDAKTAAWSVSLEKQDTVFLEPFTIELHDSAGNPLSNVEFLAWAEDPLSGNCTEAHTLHAVGGALTTWQNLDGVDYYYPVSFQLLDGYKLVVIPNGEAVSFSAYYPGEVNVDFVS